MAQVYASLGSNIGDRLLNLRRAIEALASDVVVQKVSSVYETTPVGSGEQPLFLNIALSAHTSLPPRELLRRVKAIESEMGRTPDTHNLPREIDIDILMYDDLVYDTPELTIPHPRMHERAFVLVPLDEVAPLAFHSKLEEAIADLRDHLGDCSELVWLSEERL